MQTPFKTAAAWVVVAVFSALVALVGVVLLVPLLDSCMSLWQGSSVSLARWAADTGFAFLGLAIIEWDWSQVVAAWAGRQGVKTGAGGPIAH